MRVCLDFPEIFRTPYQVLLVMTGDTLVFFNRPRRILITMTFAAGNTAELVGMAQGQLVRKRDLLVPVTHPTFPQSQTFGIQVSDRQHLLRAVTGRTVT